VEGRFLAKHFSRARPRLSLNPHSLSVSKKE
jgi:hypothetical protein